MNKLLTALAIIFCSYGFSQEQYSTDSILVSQNNPTDWELYVYNEDFKIEYKFVDCDPSMGYDQEMVLLKVTNRTREILSFDWHAILYYSDKCKTCDFEDEYTFSVNVPPLQAMEGSCDIYTGYELKIFSAFIDANYTKGEKLISFELRNLTVTTNQVD